MNGEFKDLILLLGVSGSGKSTVALELASRFGLRQADSYTTREPRFEGEQGHTFITYVEYLQKMMDHELVAYTEINGFFYGVDQKMADDAQIYVIDPDGAEEFIKLYQTDRTIYYIFLDVSAEQRDERMIGRGTGDDVVNRMEADKHIADRAHEVGEKYPIACYIENNDLEKTINTIVKITGLRE